MLLFQANHLSYSVKYDCDTLKAYTVLKVNRIDSSHIVFTGKEWTQVKPLLSVHPFPGESLTSKSHGDRGHYTEH